MRSLLYTLHRARHLHQRQGASALGTKPPQDRRPARSAGRHLPPADDIDQPCWLDRQATTGIIVAVGNGLLDVEQRRLIPHTPLFFNQTSVPFDYRAGRADTQTAGSTSSRRFGPPSRRPSTCSASGSAM